MKTPSHTLVRFCRQQLGFYPIERRSEQRRSTISSWQSYRSSQKNVGKKRSSRGAPPSKPRQRDSTSLSSRIALHNSDQLSLSDVNELETCSPTEDSTPQPYSQLSLPNFHPSSQPSSTLQRASVSSPIRRANPHRPQKIMGRRARRELAERERGS